MLPIFKQRILRWLLQFQLKPWMWPPSHKRRSLSCLSTIAFQNSSCGSGNILLLTAETKSFACLHNVSPSDHSPVIINVSLAMTSRAKAIFNSSVVQNFVNNSSVYFRVNSREEQKRQGNRGVGRRRLQRAWSWKDEGERKYREPLEDKPKWRGGKRNHTKTSKSTVVNESPTSLTS